MKHACVASDPRGDQGHRGPEFMLFHKSTLLTYEGSILAVDPKIGAIPWWNMPLDSAPVLNVDGTVNVSAGKYYCPNASSLPFGVGSPNDDPSVANPGCDPINNQSQQPIAHSARLIAAAPCFNRPQRVGSAKERRQKLM